MRPNVTRYRIQWFLMTAVVQEFISRLERTTALLLAQELLTSKPWAYDTAIFSRNYETMNATLFTIMNDEAHNLRATFFFNKLVSHSQNIVLIPVRYSRIVHILSIFQCICLTSLTRAKWNFPLNFQTMRKLSDLYSGIFQTQSSGCASGVDLFRKF